MKIEEVLREMRDIADDQWEGVAPAVTIERWVDVIELAMRERDDEVEAAREWLRGHAEIDKAKTAEIEFLRESIGGLADQAVSILVGKQP